MMVVLASGFGIYGATQADRWLHYTPVEARVTHVTSSCWLEEVTGRIVKGEVHRTDPSTCAAAEELHESIDYRQWDLKGQATVVFDYTSPADGRVHSGELTFDYATQKSKAELSEGDGFTVLAHNREAGKLRVD
jgi:hypothetical protein